MSIRVARRPAFLLALALTVLLVQAVGYLVHGVLLEGLYESASPGLFRSEPEMMARVWGYWLGSALAVFTLGILLDGGEAKPTVAQGARLGLLLGLYHGVAGAAEQWVSFELSGSMALAWMTAAIGTSTLAGAVFAGIAGRAYTAEIPR